MIPFQAFPKIARLSREIVITEKIDGTNASIYIEDVPKEQYVVEPDIYADNGFGPENCVRVMRVGSRTRWIGRKTDNHGFANWAFDNAEDLMQLGPGHHFGEWWGAGIQRRYGLDHKRFSLFNVGRWNEENKPKCCHVVPTLYKGPMSLGEIEAALRWLDAKGSVAAPGFMDPEGIIIFHTAAGICFKKTIKDDESPKGLNAQSV